MSAPKLFTTLPDASILRIGATGEPSQVLPPQRSNTQMLLPSGSTSTPIVCPHLRPSGSFAQFLDRPIGIGRVAGLRLRAHRCHRDRRDEGKTEHPLRLLVHVIPPALPARSPHRLVLDVLHQSFRPHFGAVDVA